MMLPLRTELAMTLTAATSGCWRADGGLFRSRRETARGMTNLCARLVSQSADRMTISPTAKLTPWWSRDAYEDRRPLLLARSWITAALRRGFEADGFVEVETASLQVSPGNEAHIA